MVSYFEENKLRKERIELCLKDISQLNELSVESRQQKKVKFGMVPIEKQPPTSYTYKLVLRNGEKDLATCREMNREWTVNSEPYFTKYCIIPLNAYFYPLGDTKHESISRPLASIPRMEHFLSSPLSRHHAGKIFDNPHDKYLLKPTPIKDSTASPAHSSRNSPLAHLHSTYHPHVEFLKEVSSIDSQQDMITMSPHQDHAGKSSQSSLILISSKMCHDSSTMKRIPFPKHIDSKKMDRVALACRSTSKELQHRLSISSDGSTNPSMTDDPFASSTSEISNEDHDDYDKAAAELWDEWWAPVKDTLKLRSSFYQMKSGTRSAHHLRTQNDTLSPYNRNFGVSSLSDQGLSKDPLTEVHRTAAIQNSRARYQRRSQTNLHPSHENQDHPQYTAFPPLVPPKPPGYRCSPHTSHKSWPTRSSSGPARSRAYTAPSHPHTKPPNPHANTVRNPSNLSFCTSATTPEPNSRQTSASSGSPLYTHTATSSPTQPLMQMMSLEKSVFEDDEDGDDEGKGGFVRMMESKLHIRSGSDGDTSKEKQVEGVDKKGRNGSLMLKARTALKDVFRGRKSVG
ncbi:hypothetical protein BJ875DRAFT_444486 [Amylocarpus encephaloides]|uniref:Uncharacterized protein n=1 Tax=Amylocarpus encephaloides TaxID=45428 RepID=A0A9P7YC35_9HELO|nr:hypothetical protein BJ875DRAFT_444486 [Amylocarpus encephaloides]